MDDDRAQATTDELPGLHGSAAGLRIKKRLRHQREPPRDPSSVLPRLLSRSPKFITKLSSAQLGISRGGFGSTEVEFDTVARAWLLDTGHLSVARDAANHPEFSRLAAMGRPIIPLILVRLHLAPFHFSVLLEEITRSRPPKVQQAQTAAQLTRAWKEWWRKRRAGS